MRSAVLLALLVSLACDKPPEDVPVAEVETKTTPPVKKPDPVLPSGGIGNIQQSHDLVAREIEKCEKALEANEPVERRIAADLLKNVEYLIKVTEIAIRQDAALGLKDKHARMVTRQAEIRQSWVEAEQEVAHMRNVLDGVAKGTDTVPEGFTEAEIRDRLGDWLELARARKEELETFNAEMAKVEEILQLPPEQIPAATETLFSRELEDLKVLKDRAARVLAKATDPQ